MTQRGRTKQSKLKVKASLSKSDSKGIPRSTTKKRKASGPSSLKSNLSTDIWPLERDLIVRPDRYKYVRKIIKPTGCVFCQCAKGPLTEASLTLFKTKWSMVVLNKFPYNNGHLLVIPQRHCGDLKMLSDQEYGDLMSLLRKAMTVLQKVYQPEGMNVGLNHGAVAGAGIPEHVHWHIVPRWFGDVNFFPMIAETKVVIETLETTYQKLKEAWGDENEL